jgi:hypothetical protein
MEKFQKPSNSACYTPSSEPFRIYSQIDLNVFAVGLCNNVFITASIASFELGTSDEC